MAEEMSSLTEMMLQGIGLHTMATHPLQRTPCVGGKQALTTFSDYVNHYPSTLQVTSYNFTATETTKELCTGIVKASGVFPKKNVTTCSRFGVN